MKRDNGIGLVCAMKQDVGFRTKNYGDSRKKNSQRLPLLHRVKSSAHSYSQMELNSKNSILFNISKKMIFNYDIRYALAKIPVKLAFRLNFTKLVYINRKNIPENTPVIFTPNHRNALIDALTLVYASRHFKQIVFLARADIFKQKTIAWILRGLRILPIFRIRDGKDNLEKNQEIFETCGRILQKKNPIALFPEGRHNPQQSLLPIRKAVPRIVLPTEAQFDFSLNSSIIPVAIYYTDTTDFLPNCCVTFGEPIPVNDYKTLYDKENPNHAIGKLRADLEERMKQMVVNIRNDAFYDEYLDALAWNRHRVAKELFPNRKDDELQASLYIVKKLDNLFDNDKKGFAEKMKNLQEAKTLAESNRLTPKDNLFLPTSPAKRPIGYAVLAATAPIALFGFANNIFPILLYRKLRGMFRDKQFVASVRYVSGLFFVPVFDIIQSLILHLFLHNWAITLAYFFAMPAGFAFAIHWRRLVKAAHRQNIVSQFKKKKPAIFKKLQDLVRI